MVILLLTYRRAHKTLLSSSRSRLSISILYDPSRLCRATLVSLRTSTRAHESCSPGTGRQPLTLQQMCLGVWPLPVPTCQQSRRRLGRRACHGCRSAWSMAWSRARANLAAAKCKPGALLSAKQEGADFRRARKLGQRHQLVHHLLQQLAPG